MFSSKKINEIPFWEIIKKSWGITWNNKFLWWLGLFISLTSLNLPSSGEWQENGFSEDKFIAFWEGNTTIILIALGCLFLLFLVFIFLSLTSRGGMIYALNQINQNKKTTFGESFREGKKNFVKLFVLGFLIFFFVFIIFSVVSIPAIYCFLNEKIATGVLISIPAFLIVLVTAILAAYLKIFGQIYLIVGKIKPLAAIENAYKLFKANLWSSLVLGLIMIPVSAISSILILGILLILGLLMLPFVGILWLALKDVGLMISAVFAVPVLLAGVLLVSSVFQTFRQSIWFLFFREIALNEKTEALTAENTVKVSKKTSMGSVTTSKID